MREFDERMRPCPALPGVEVLLTAETTRSLGGERGAGFYVAALSYAQSLWREGKPAQAILQLNKALAADLTSVIPLIEAGVSPYRALLWILQNAPTGCFLGNPVRHFQHLATRMSGARADTRAWRAWACFHLAERVLSGGDFPRDWHQIRVERVVVPVWREVVAALAVFGWPGETAELVCLAGELGIAG